MRLLIAIIILMLVGGGIAYIGDWLGLYIGKRRLSLRGLRPRTSARVITALAGGLIALLTFFILLGVDSGFKLAIQQGAQIIHRNHVLNIQNRRLSQSVHDARAAVMQAQSDALSARAAEATAVADRSRAQQQLSTVDRQLSVVNGQLTTAQGQLASTRSQLSTTQTNLSGARDELARDRQSQTVLNGEITLAKADLQQMARQTKARFNGSLIYRANAEIGRTVIAAGQPIGATKQQIEIFLVQLSADALAHGGGRGANGHGVELIPVGVGATTVPAHKSTGPRPAPPRTLIPESENIEALAEQIHGFDNGGGSVVVVAVVALNAFAGDQVKVVLRPYVNRLAIPVGAQLGQITIPANERDPDGILGDLQRFLVETVRPTAVHLGVIPVKNPQLHEIQLGNVPVSELYRIIDQVRRIPGAAVVTASAAQDTDSANLSGLQLKFTVTPAVTSASAGSYE